ncbi:MAG: hypothetical protein ACKO2S_06930, partial [Burkholderiaceae bacterium]
RLVLSSLLLAALTGCASQSEMTAIRLDRDNPKFKSAGCQDSLSSAETHKDIKMARTIASPVLLFFSGGLLIPVVAANAGLDTVDHVDAAKIAESCGGKPQTKAEMATDVAVGAAVGVATSAINPITLPTPGLASK